MSLCVGFKLIPVSPITAVVQTEACYWLGPLVAPLGHYLRIQYEVNGKGVIHDVAALHCLKFHMPMLLIGGLPVSVRLGETCVIAQKGAHHARTVHPTGIRRREVRGYCHIPKESIEGHL